MTVSCGNNTCYEQNGFKRLEDSDQGFFWWKDNLIHNRRGLWKGLLPKKLERFDPQISAHNNLRNHGYVKIWDIGQSKFEWIQKKDEEETKETEEIK